MILENQMVNRTKMMCDVYDELYQENGSARVEEKEVTLEGVSSSIHTVNTGQ